MTPGSPGADQDVVITVAEGGGMFAVAQATGQFLWARPFPYDDPNININVVDLKTGSRDGDDRARVNGDRAVFREFTHRVEVRRSGAG